MLITILVEARLAFNQARQSLPFPNIQSAARLQVALRTPTPAEQPDQKNAGKLPTLRCTYLTTMFTILRGMMICLTIVLPATNF